MRVISPAERLVGERVTLRLCTEEDCGPRYLGWLLDPEVNRFLETRWSEQTLDSIRGFVRSQLESPNSYLFAILDNEDGQHVGNIKVGPIIPHHNYADLSYFIGERDRWGKGLASEAIALATEFGFARLGLDRMQAGLYSSNLGSRRVLEKAGYQLEGCLRAQLVQGDGREDHLFLGLLRPEWEASASSRRRSAS